MKTIFLDVIMQKKMLGGGFMIITFPVKFYEMSQKNKITRAQSDVLIVDIVRAAAKHHWPVDYWHFHFLKWFIVHFLKLPLICFLIKDCLMGQSW